jgi:BirA family transcriptional regulator, biotin operon repressor / biotin---[acetyl-CoA-carboxylase] ligase
MRYPPLDADALRSELAGIVARLDVVERTGSTNADLAAAARAGAADRTVLVAEMQDAGRGRLDRRWVSPTGAGLTFSVLLRPKAVPRNRLGWLPLLAGLSVVRAIRSLTSVEAALKWPNDVLLGPDRAKGAGLLAELAGVGDEPAVVLGIGLNVRTEPDQLPPGATSLCAQGADVSREELLVAILRGLLADEADWRAAGGDPDATGLRAGYRAACATLGARVRIELPGSAGALEAVAGDVDEDGRLVVRQRDGATRAVAAGDVVHLRPSPG